MRTSLSPPRDSAVTSHDPFTQDGRVTLPSGKSNVQQFDELAQILAAAKALLATDPKTAFTMAQEAADSIVSHYGSRMLHEKRVWAFFRPIVEAAAENIRGAVEVVGAANLREFGAPEQLALVYFARRNTSLLRELVDAGAPLGIDGALRCKERLAPELLQGVTQAFVRALEIALEAPPELPRGLVLRVSYPNTPNEKQVLRHFFQIASPSIIEGWIKYLAEVDTMPSADPSIVAASLKERPISDRDLEVFDLVAPNEPSRDTPFALLLRLGITGETLARYLRLAPSIDDAFLPLEALAPLVSREEANHIIRITDGRLRQLACFVGLLSAENCSSSERISSDYILGLRELDPAIRMLEERLLERISPKLEQAEARARVLWKRQMVEEEGQSAEASLASFKDRVLAALRASFVCGAAASAAAVERAIERDKFLELSSGMLDGKMLLPPTHPYQLQIMGNREISNFLLGPTLARLLADSASDRADAQTAVPTFLRSKLNRVVNEVAGLVRQRWKRESSASDLGQFAVAYLQSEDFVARQLAEVLAKCRVSIPTITIRISPKSDPACWTAGNQVRCCAEFGALHQMDSLFRLDCAHLLIEDDKKVVGMSRVWVGSEAGTIILNNIELADWAMDESKPIAACIREFLKAYREGRVPLVHKEHRPWMIAKVHIGEGSGDVNVDELPSTETICPLGDSPDTEGTWSWGWNDADAGQRLFLLMDEATVS